MTRVVFFGTPELSVPFLEVLKKDPEIDVSLVVTQPDKPSGRTQECAPSPVKQAAAKLHIEIFQPVTLRSDEAVQKLHANPVDLFVVVAYGKIIPESVLEIPTRGCVNVHPSLLPTYRGPSPLAAPIANGDRQTGVSIMLLNKGMDTGPILATKTISVESRETLETLTRKVMQVGPAFLLETLKKYIAGNLSPQAQDDQKVTYTKLLTREDGRINWHASAKKIDRLIRAYEPWPGTWTIWSRSGKPLRLKILSAHPSDEKGAGTPGTVTITSRRLLMTCGGGSSLEISMLQPEGGQPMSAEIFLRGYSDVNGTVLA